jgi:hypothetical protein
MGNMEGDTIGRSLKLLAARFALLAEEVVDA